MRYHEITINAASGGFGEYDARAINLDEGYASESDAVAGIYDGNADMADVYELGVDRLPDEVEDIRGRIRNEPARVFALVAEDQVSYVGIAGI